MKWDSAPLSRSTSKDSPSAARSWSISISPKILAACTETPRPPFFRFVQECLTNVHRHSESSVAHVRVARSGGLVEAEVRDEGKGITAEKISALSVSGSPGVGLRGMKERLAQLGGTLEISCNGNGTAIVG